MSNVYKPCPKCGYSNIFTINIGVVDVYSNMKVKVKCYNCGWTGYRHDS